MSLIALHSIAVIEVHELHLRDLRLCFNINCYLASSCFLMKSLFLFSAFCVCLLSDISPKFKEEGKVDS